MSHTLTKAEAADRARLEDIIRAGLDTFYEVGGALAEIAERGLHLDTHDTFAEYCLDVWGIGKSRAYQLIGAAKVVEAVSSFLDSPPETAAHAEALIGLPPAAAAAALTEARNAAAPKAPTAKDVARAANKYIPMAERLERAEKAAAAKERREARKREEEGESTEEMASAIVTSAQQKKAEAAGGWNPSATLQQVQPPKLESGAESGPQGAPAGMDGPATGNPVVPTTERLDLPETRIDESVPAPSLDLTPAVRDEGVVPIAPAKPKHTPSAYAVRDAIAGKLNDPTDADGPVLTGTDREWFQAVNRWSQKWMAACPQAQSSAA